MTAEPLTRPQTQDDATYATEGGVFEGIKRFVNLMVESANESPLLYGVYLAVLAVPILLMMLCAGEGTRRPPRVRAVEPEAPAAAAEDREVDAALTPDTEAQAAAAAAPAAAPAEEEDAGPCRCVSRTPRLTRAVAASEPATTPASNEPEYAPEESTPRRSVRQRKAKSSTD